MSDFLDFQTLCLIGLSFLECFLYLLLIDSLQNYLNSYNFFISFLPHPSKEYLFYLPWRYYYLYLFSWVVVLDVILCRQCFIHTTYLGLLSIPKHYNENHLGHHFNFLRSQWQIQIILIQHRCNPGNVVLQECFHLDLKKRNRQSSLFSEDNCF